MDQEGAFIIGDLPAGTYRIKAWHPALGAQEQDVTMQSNGKATLNLQFDSKRSAE